MIDVVIASSVATGQSQKVDMKFTRIPKERRVILQRCSGGKWLPVGAESTVPTLGLIAQTHGGSPT
jgi:hypothetical protein